jgi:hypothetical protein
MKTTRPHKCVCRKRPRRWCLMHIPDAVLKRLLREQPDTKKWKWVYGD